MKNLVTLIIAIVVILFIGKFFIGLQNDTSVSTIENCRVINLQQQNIIHGDCINNNTEIRDLDFTDKETFICESSIINGKFNNSDIFFNLQKDSTYTFKVAGKGKSMFTDYRNILEYVKK
jgi:hypothetical protein